MVAAADVAVGPPRLLGGPGMGGGGGEGLLRKYDIRLLVRQGV